MKRGRKVKDEEYNRVKRELAELHKKGYQLTSGETFENYDHESGEFFVRFETLMIRRMKCPKGHEE